LVRLKKNQVNASLYLIGEKKLNGFGSGGDPRVGQAAFEENKDDIERKMVDIDILFIIAGLGKGTGSGVGPEVARIAKEKNIITVSIVTLPSYIIEGKKTYENAVISFEKFKNNSDSLCAISNDKIISLSSDANFIEQMDKANKEIGSIISDFVDIVSSAGEFNIDFHDLKSFLTENKKFFHCLIKLDKTYSFDDLNNKILLAIKNSFSTTEFSDQNINVIANFKINTKSQTNLISDTRKIIEGISKNNDIKLVYGIENILDNNDEISLFISCDEQNSEKFNIQQENENAKPFSVLTKQQKIDINEYKDYKTSKITKKLFDFDEDEVDEDTVQALTKIIKNEN
jgi:cell division protein FtsZ